MKALQLVKSLDRSERSGFESVLKNKGRKSLYFLWKYLLKYDGDKPEKADMYRAAFKVKYDPGKDYQLRNELRLISDELTAFILQREFEGDLKANPNFRNARYLKALRRRNLDEIFLAEYDKIHSKAESEMQIDLSEEMAWEKMLLLYRQLDTQYDLAREVYEFAEEYVDAVTRRARFHVRVAEYDREIARTRWSLHPINKNTPVPGDKPPRHSLDIHDRENDAALIRFYAIFTNALHCGPEERIRLLEQALNALEKCDFPGTEFLRLKARCLNGMGITYYQLDEFEKQFDMFRQSLQCLEASGHRSITKLMNYLLGLLYQKHTAIFWQELERFRHWFDTLSKRNGLNRIIHYAHMVDGSYDEALTAVNNIEVTTDAEYLMVKSALVTIYYHKREFDSVITESTNALQVLRHRDDDVLRYQCYEFEFKLAIQLAGYEMELPEKRDEISGRIRKLLSSASDEVIWNLTHQFLRSKWVLDRAEEVCGQDRSDLRSQNVDY